MGLNAIQLHAYIACLGRRTGVYNHGDIINWRDFLHVIAVTTCDFGKFSSVNTQVLLLVVCYASAQ